MNTPQKIHAPGRDATLRDEPRLGAMLRVVAARAARRPLLVLLVAALASTAAIGLRMRLPPLYAATLTFRMTEGALQDTRAAPRPPAEIREYITNVALTRTKLLEVMERHGISRRQRAVDPDAAIASMREDLEVEVVRNYFLLERSDVSGPRSAQVLLTFWGGDPGVVGAVVHDLGRLVLEAQAAERTARLDRARAVGAAEARQLQHGVRRLQERQGRLLAQEQAASPVERARVRADLAGIRDRLRRAVGRVRELERRTGALELYRAAEDLALGLTFQVVDERVMTVRAPLDAARVARLVALLFVFALPVAAVAVGAFDPRVYRPDDLVTSGIPLLGAVPHLRVGPPVDAPPAGRGEKLPWP